ncbi:hypothetical protein BDE02_03G010800 [Populus trichocarpa]|nr:hypothetical protein BDE02_03G010800 [Populus trichocarpa]
MNNITDSAYISTLTILHNIRFQIVYHLNGSEMNTNFLISDNLNIQERPK